MQYCAASAATKLVPYSESILSRCGNGGFRYCDSYLQLARPHGENVPRDPLAVDQGLRYTANHFWLDLSGERYCHIGIDTFLARLLGRVDAIEYLTGPGVVRPAAVLTLGGVDFQVIFPERLDVSANNLYLRAEPSRLTSEPYTSGWLFEAAVDPALRRSLESRLMDGPAAQLWMEEESRRINQSLQARCGGLAADGGLFLRGVLSNLPREDSLRLFHQFCPPVTGNGGPA